MTQESVKIRKAQQGDVTAMVSLLGELFTLERDFQPEPVKQQLGLLLLLKRSDAVVLVAEAEGRVIGMCSVQTMISTAEGGPSGFLEDLIVTENWRGKKVGSMLLEAAESWAKQQGYTRIQLLADAGNTPALEFYSLHNWQNTNLIARKKPLY